MTDGGPEAADAVVGAHLGLVANRAHVKEISWKRMVILAASCFWFCVATSLAFLIRFASRKLFSRVNREEDNYRHSGGSNFASARLLEDLIEASKSDDEEADASEEKEEPGFQFRFSFQLPSEQSSSSREVEVNSEGDHAAPSTTLKVRNYRFMSGRDLRGFLEAPRAMTVCVQESYMGSDGASLHSTEDLDGQLRSRLSALKSSQLAPNSNAGKTVLAGDDAKERFHAEEIELDKTTDELDKELNNRLSSVKCYCSPQPGEDRPEGAALRCLVPDEVFADDAEELDRDLRTRLSSVKSPRQAESAAMGAIHGEQEVCSGGDILDDTQELDRELTTRFLSVKNSSWDVAADVNTWTGGSFPGTFCKTEDVFEQLEPVVTHFTDQENKLHNGGSLPADVPSPARACLLSEVGFHSETESGSSMSDGYSVKDLNVDFDSDGFVFERDFEQQTGIESLIELGREKEQNLDTDGEVNEREAEAAAPLEIAHSHNSGTARSDCPRRSSAELGERWEDAQREARMRLDADDSLEDTHVDESKELSTKEEEELESLWEHQDLIDQLRMELRRVRSIGLPTILEESESPKPMGDLKPLRFDGKFLHEDPMDELHKFHKSYRERMRKFDILNYQKMYAIGFLQLKGPLQSVSTQKPLLPALGSLLSQHIWPHRRKSGADASETLVRELHSDLETVYVGHACLSWEFLRWQYEMVRELLNSDLQVGRQYSQAAGEFQQFEVLIQRFLEDERFQGPRVSNYVKSRCVLRSLLQVPVIREDCLTEKTEELGKGEETAATRGHLEYVMEKSIRVFWEFVLADTDEAPIIALKGLVGSPVELQDPADRDLMADIQANLQKKEKKLRDIVRTGNCLVKKFRRPARDDARRYSPDDVFFSQVDLKLVARVLKMTRITTDQLMWCRKKLSKINFVERKLEREPSFSLFPY